MKALVKRSLLALCLLASIVATTSPASAHDPFDQTATVLTTVADYASETPSGNACWTEAFGGGNVCQVLDGNDVLECTTTNPATCVLHADGNSTTACATAAGSIVGGAASITLNIAAAPCTEWNNPGGNPTELVAFLSMATESGETYSVKANGETVQVTGDLDIVTEVGNPLPVQNVSNSSNTWSFRPNFNRGQCNSAEALIATYLRVVSIQSQTITKFQRQINLNVPCDGYSAYQTIFNLSGEAGVTATDSLMLRLYWAVFDRAPDVPGARYWMDQLDRCRNLRNIAQFFTQSPEFDRLYGDVTNQEFVTLIYNNVLNRAPDTAGFNFWLGRLQTGLSREEMVLQVSDSPEFVTEIPLQSDNVPNVACTP